MRTVRSEPTAIELALSKAAETSQGSHVRHIIKENLKRVKYTRRVSKKGKQK